MIIDDDDDDWWWWLMIMIDGDDWWRWLMMMIDDDDDDDDDDWWWPVPVTIITIDILYWCIFLPFWSAPVQLWFAPGLYIGHATSPYSLQAPLSRIKYDKI